MKKTIESLEYAFLENKNYSIKNDLNYFLFLLKQPPSQLSRFSKAFLHKQILKHDVNQVTPNDLNNIFMNIVQQRSFDCFFKKTINHLVYETNYSHINSSNVNFLIYFYYFCNIRQQKNKVLKSQHIDYIIEHSKITHRNNRNHNAFGFIIEAISYNLCNSISIKSFQKLFFNSDLKFKNINSTNNYIILLFHIHCNPKYLMPYLNNSIFKNILVNNNRNDFYIFTESLRAFDAISSMTLYEELNLYLEFKNSHKKNIKI